MSGADRERTGFVAALVVLAGALLAFVGYGANDKPALHRSARPAWCPSVIMTIKDHRLRNRGHGHFDARRLVGLKLGAASQLAARNHCRVRVVGGDSNPVVALDLRTTRINVDVEDGIVTGLDSQFGGPIG